MKTLTHILFMTCWLIANISNSGTAAPNSTDNLIKSIDKKVSEIEAYRSHHKDEQKEYLIEDHNDKLELTEMPYGLSSDESEASYYLLYDLHGRLLSHTEVPLSRSGDWYRENTHYFDNDGRTIMFEDYSYHYNSGCTYLLNVRTRYYFDSQFNVIKKTTTYTDKDNKPIIAPEKCEQYGTGDRDEDVIQPNYANIQQRISRNLIKYNEQRINYVQIQKKWKERMAKSDAEYAVYLRREYIKHIIRSILYTISALAILAAIILLIRKKIKKQEK